MRAEGGSLQNRKLQNRDNPANCVLVHVLPHCPRGTGLHHCSGVNRDLKSGCQRDNEGKQNNDSKSPAVYPCCSNFLHGIRSNPVQVYNIKPQKPQVMRC
jgi:hypothetical protein